MRIAAFVARQCHVSMCSKLQVKPLSKLKAFSRAVAAKTFQFVHATLK